MVQARDGTTQAEKPGPAGSAPAAPAISLPKGGGAIRGMGEKFAANPVTGTGSMSVPIATSPGRSGFGPQLSLSYDSGAGNGPFGFGWSLSLPSITRKTDKGLPQYFDDRDSDVFILSGAEDLVPEFKKDSAGHWEIKEGKHVVLDESRTIGTDTYTVRRYRPRIEGLFARIERWTNDATGETHWRSITRDNVTTLYGKDNNSRIFDPNDPYYDPKDPQKPPTRIFSWLICQSYDDKGNAIVYEYQPEDSQRILEDPQGQVIPLAHERDRSEANRSAQRYLKRIKYGNRKPNRDQTTWQAIDPSQLSQTDWMFEVVFDYGEGHYQITSAANANPVLTTARLSPSGHWPVRQDPFSTYRAGFEVRTYRLCRRVLLFHHFPNELGTADYLVRSTEFAYDESPVASFITQVTQSGYLRQTGGVYLKKSLPPLDFSYSKVPTADELARRPVETVDPGSLENLPMGLDGAAYQWMDLDGEGTSGILTEQADGWFYKRNLSANNQALDDGDWRTVACFGPAELVARKPAGGLAGGAQFLDLAGDGQVDLVQMEGPVRGFYERTDDASWAAFQPFISWPNLNTRDLDLKFVDLTGDGHADILITEAEALTWHPSLAEDGFGPSVRVIVPLDEEKGPRLVFADGTQSIYLADLSGDGLSDLVRIRNGAVCYWPNLGYGRFGAGVTMDDAPWFDAFDQFDQRRIRLADTDGSGATDILYLRRDGVQIYFNQSGNGWSKAVALPQFPPIDNISSVQALDLLGNGTACLVWSSPLPGAARRQMRYLALMEEKPHLLIGTQNNLGAETKVQYAPSTKFYLDDKRDGRPWITRLPFPVHVIERVETYDRISRNRFVTRYAYHHGYFDGEEWEFRGFGMVVQQDTEEIGTVAPGTVAAEDTNWDAASFVPPVLTKTWFHTGAYIEGGRISKQFEHEYYREGDASRGETGLSDQELEAMLLPDTVLPAGLTADEAREACRSLKGAILRQEVYALDKKPDGTPAEKSDRPYSVSERNYTVGFLQPRDQNRHAVFFTHARETLDFHYERQLVDISGTLRADPRVSHALTLKVDEYGNVERAVAVGYRRRDVPALLDEQKETHLTLTVNRFANKAGQADWYRIGLPVETRTFEIVKAPEPTVAGGLVGLFLYATIDGLVEGLFPSNKIEPDPGKTWPYEKWDWQQKPTNAPSNTRLRLIEHVRTLYRKDNLTGFSPLATIESLALPGESYKLAFTPDLVTAIYVATGKLPQNEVDTALETDGGYVHSENDANWWIPAGTVYFDVNADIIHPASTATQELAAARKHFFLPRKFTDPFGHSATVDYDGHDLLITETRDALDNVVTVDTLDDAGSAAIRNNYRVLQPYWVTDPNHNRTRVAFDALGLVVATAVMGKPPTSSRPAEGDELDTFTDSDANPTLAALQNFMKDPRTQAQGLLKNATTRIVYDLDRYARCQQPPFAATLARETHVSDLSAGTPLKIQLSFLYSDGFGREIQTKIQAEGGDAPVRKPDDPITAGTPPKPTGDIRPGDLVRAAGGRMTQAKSPRRWVGTGRTVYNNKGKPVKKYEPFFSSTHLYETELDMTDTGVTPTLFYDPVERVVATLHPNHTYEKVVFDPWRQETWDVNDTVLVTDPKADGDVGCFFSRLAIADYRPTWHDLRTDAAKALQQWPDTDLAGNPLPDNAKRRTAEKNAAAKAAFHTDTPTVAHFDALGRPCLTLADNGPDPAQPGKHLLFATRVILDIEGNQRAVIDAKDRIVMRYDYDMLGNRIHAASMEAGARWMLNDVTGKPIYAWDSRGHRFRTAYDRLRRPTDSSLRQGTGAEMVVGRSIYGESRPHPEDNNLRGKVIQLFDQAGVVTSEKYDFKGNLLCSQRQLAEIVDPHGTPIAAYKTTINWSGAVQLETVTYTSRTRYDALNRPTQMIAPHSDQSGTMVNVIQPSYNEANLLEQLHAWLNQNAEPAGCLDPTTANLRAVTNIDYDAKGQRTRIDHGTRDGKVIKTSYTYDRETFRLTHLYTRRGVDPLTDQGTSFTDDCDNPQPPPQTIAAPENPPQGKWCGLQNLHYTYDPAGNITHIRDDAQQTIYFRNKRVEPSAEYTYDAIYRLIEATGREHLGLTGTVPNAPTPHSYSDAPRVGIWEPGPGNQFHPGDGKAMGMYVEQYVYDAVGNILSMQHRGTDPVDPGWTRNYEYDEDSLTEPATPTQPAKKSNRLSKAPLNSDPFSTVKHFDYDAHGNMTHMPHLAKIEWDFKDELGAAHLGGGGTAYYVYDAAGQRVRKVIHNQNDKATKERIYLGGFEMYREYDGTGSTTPRLERETLHIMDDKQRIALVETKTNDASVPASTLPETLIRYQFGNHLGSASLELDDTAKIITYEEYAPYGSTSYQAVRNKTETPKRYRSTSKERDEESGLYYHGARYYAPWLGRWASCDPAGVVQTTNLYLFVLGSPVLLWDPDGKAGRLGPEFPIDWGRIPGGPPPPPPRPQSRWRYDPTPYRRLRPGVEPKSPTTEIPEGPRSIPILQTAIELFPIAFVIALWMMIDTQHNDTQKLVNGLNRARAEERRILPPASSGGSFEDPVNTNDRGPIEEPAGANERGPFGDPKAPQGANINEPTNGSDVSYEFHPSLVSGKKKSAAQLELDELEIIRQDIDDLAATAIGIAIAEKIPGTFGRLGTKAHEILEGLIADLNSELQNRGSIFRVISEQFRDKAGNPVGRRAPGSLGIDILIVSKGMPFEGIDLKSGRGMSQEKLDEIERRIGAPACQVGPKVPDYAPP